MEKKVNPMEKLENFTVSSLGLTAEKENEEAFKKEEQARAEKEEAKDQRGLNKKFAATLMKTESQRSSAYAKEDVKHMKGTEDALKKKVAYQINLYLQRFPWLNDKVPKLNRSEEHTSELQSQR